MHLGTAGLKEQPFKESGWPIVFVGYEGQERASGFLKETCDHNSGLALLQGPPGSGKTTILKHFIQHQKPERAIAKVDGAGLNTAALLADVLKKFGYEHEFDSINELLGMLKVFMRQQTATATAPTLIIENIHDISPGALRVLCELAAVRVREKFALKIILVSDRSINYIVRAPAMDCMLKRLTGDFHLEPMTLDETNDYIYTKLRHGGCIDPELVIPEDVADEFYQRSGGWPGLVDRLALDALAMASDCPIDAGNVSKIAIPKRTGTGGEHEAVPISERAKHPILFLIHNGKVLNKIKFEGTRLLIGRSAHNDVSIDSKFISRHHALLVRNGSSTLLMDLNSANGTYVNSWRVSNQVLLHNDVITIGEHGLKFMHVAARDRAALESDQFKDTVVMQSMADMRRVLAREYTDPNPQTGADPNPQAGESPGASSDTL